MGHMEQYVPGCNKVYSYLQARSDKVYDKTVFFGLQYILKEYLTQPITHDNVREFLDVRTSILGSTRSDVMDKMRSLADLGYWPLEIKAVEEGSVIPVKNVLMTITNTHPDFYWTVGFVESLLLKLWYPITVATTSYQYKQLVHKYFKETVANNLNFLKPFMVHDFGYRGDSSEESAEISGMAHLTSFMGSDTVPAFNASVKYYNADSTGANDKTIMSSVPASEHSVMCSFGKDGELEAYKHMLKLYDTGIVSIVSDTYDIWNVLTNYASVLKEDILKRKGKVVFRPDSGNPELIICGDPKADPGTPEHKGCLKLLDEMFGSYINLKGYRQINPSVGLIYGDGMYVGRYERTLERMKEMGYAASNLVIGVGGILRHHSRDTLGFAIKATKVEVGGVERSIMKDPITDKSKKSHQGYLCLAKDANDNYLTLDNVNSTMEKQGLLKPVFINGKLIGTTADLYAIRRKIENSLTI
jgi:nicotinamide phosphoribosyltransferase